MSFAENYLRGLRSQMTLAGLLQAQEDRTISEEDFQSLLQETTEGNPDEAWAILSRLAPLSAIKGGAGFVNTLKPKT